MIRPVILSGGEGKRLWPLSRPERPKQFLALIGRETLLQQTVRRLFDPALFEAPIIIGGAGQRFLIAEQLRAAGLAARRIVLEPTPRNTAPALAVGALLAIADDPDALILSVHADGSIPDPAGFRANIARGVAAAAGGAVVLFGVTPTYPATGYGYIEPGPGSAAAVRPVGRFLEKPDEATAKRLMAAGCLWNSGVFLMRAARLIGELEAHAPAALAAARAAIASGEEDADFLRLGADAFAAAPNVSIDYAVMERIERAVVIAADFVWSDIGAWSAVWDCAEKDADGNVAVGAVVLETASGSLVYAEGVRVAVRGVADLVVVATPDRVLVTRRGEDQAVRGLGERADALPEP
jgi:mannose-1-phosphate guanylyltransferase/mannose-1-phosphate guanylyltransferase/mannose-6-phosphate isomerase